MIKPWTSRPSVIDLVLELFNTTAMVVETPTDMDSGARGKKEQPLSQLPELASLLFACIKERLDWLNRLVSMM
jgi:nuclear pore complex protein Nup133